MHKRRVWEIDTLFYCPLVGLCLTIAQQKHLLRRCGIMLKEERDYTVHVAFIESVKEESLAAKRLERILDRKYQKKCAEWQGKSPEEWITFFHRSLTPATAGALVWFSAVYADLSQKQRNEIYGEIHALGHQQFWEQGVLFRKLERDRKQRLTLQAKHQDIRSCLKESRKKLEQCKRRNALQQQEIERLRIESSGRNQEQQLTELRMQCDELRLKLSRVEEKLHTRTIAVEELKSEREQLQQHVDTHHLIVEEMQQELAKFLDQLTRAASEAEHCPNSELCNRRVLIVGGMTKLRSFYEQLVTKMGGQFEYHDGYKYSGVETLSRMVDRSDVVICPVDVNSHSACLYVKKCCKELNKPYYMLRSSSVSTIHRALTDVAKSG